MVCLRLLLLSLTHSGGLFYWTDLTHCYTVLTALSLWGERLKSSSNQEAFILHCLSDSLDTLSSGLVAVVRPDSSRVCVWRGVEQLRAGSRAFLAFLQTPFPSRSAVRKGLCAQWAGLAQDSSHDGANSCWSVSCSSVSVSVCWSASLSACGSTSAPATPISLPRSREWSK